ncbi:MAG: uroporphyrinogen-III synthase [Agitococcus sp.]
MANLTGLRIVNTRPEQRAVQLTQALEQQGATVFSLPLLETVALELSAVSKDCLLNLDRYHSVFVVSPTAADLGLNALADFWPQWPVGIEWLAIGQSTAQVLRSYLIEPIVPKQETSEGLLQLPQLQQLAQGQRLLVLRGEGGRNLVRDSLQNRGINVDYVDLYRRQLPQCSVQQWQLIQQQTIDVVIISSGETLKQWQQLAGQQAQNIPILVISPRLVKLAHQQGFKTVLSSASIYPKDICNTLSQWHKV